MHPSRTAALWSFALLLAVHSAMAQTPDPSLTMQLNHAGKDSIVISLRFQNNNAIWNCEGIQAAVAYDPLKLQPRTIAGRPPIHGLRYASQSWSDLSNPYLEYDGVAPDVMSYGEVAPNNSSVTIGANQIFTLCKMVFDPQTNDQVTSFAYYSNTGSAGLTGYLWISDPDLRAFASATGLDPVYYPIELESLTATLVGASVELRWRTLSETNNHGFMIERRRLDAAQEMDWQSITFVAGSGTTTQSRDYLVLDRSAHRGAIYSYRLKQIDTDGSVWYSPQVTVETALEGERTFLSQNFPNPIFLSRSNITRINYSVPPPGNAEVQLRLFDLLGVEVQRLAAGSKPAGDYSVEVDCSRMQTGSYYYVLSIDGRTSTRLMQVVR